MPRPARHATPTARVEASRRRHAEAGARRISVMLSPGAARALEMVMAREDCTISVAVERGLMRMVAFHGE